MRIGLSVHVLMGNDYPDAVFLTKRGLDRAIARLKGEHARKQREEPWNVPPHHPGIYWRGYEFPIGPQFKFTPRWWRRIR